MVCWESMACLEEQAITRMPSLYAVIRQLDYKHPTFSNGINEQKAAYVLNPDNNLDYTEKTFQPFLDRYTNYPSYSIQFMVKIIFQDI